jgi:hypothetical protein
VWYCSNCKHTEKHIPALVEENTKIMTCKHCRRCKEQRESRHPVLPDGISYLIQKYRR